MPRLVMAWQSWTIALALLQVAQFSETARAADDRTCDAYAAEAVAKARLVRDKNCGYDLSNPQWSLDFGAHVRWCLNAESSSVDTERANRELKSDLCEACRAYAISAAATVARAVDQKCLVQISGGARWNPNEQSHFQWCIGLEKQSLAANELPSLAQDESTARAEELGLCLVGKTQQGVTAAPATPINPREGFSTERASRKLKQHGDNVSGSVDAARQGGKFKRKADESNKTTRIYKSKNAGPCLTADGRPCVVPNKLINPGLLEGDSGFASQVPAAIGSRGPTSSPSRATIR